MEKKHNRYEKPVLEKMDLVGEGLGSGNAALAPWPTVSAIPAALPIPIAPPGESA